MFDDLDRVLCKIISKYPKQHLQRPELDEFFITNVGDMINALE